VYFREYGSSREVDRDTGDWTTDKNSLSLEKRGSELIHFTVDKDAKTPYGVPRWINQLPSVLGSRKSEIFNLDFFDSGGLPPALVFVEGGSLGKAVLEQLNLYLSGKANAKQRVAVVEVPASAGTIESVGKVNVKVERFGDSRTGDSLFQTYDSNCEQRTRAAFRLPALFFGKEQSYNFATAMTAYMVTEAQVFAPERLEFDEIINRTIMQELGIRNYEFKSMPITLHNAELQLKALNLIQGKVESEDVVNTINDITGLTLQYSEEAEAKNNPFGGMNPFEEEEEDEDDEDDVSGQPKNKFKPGLGKPDRGLPVIKSERLTANGVVQLAAHWITAMGLEKNGHKYSDVEKAQVINKVESLNGEARQLFNSILAARGFGSTGNDGLEELAGQCCEILSRGHTH
jgi:capsid portal protein